MLLLFISLDFEYIIIDTKAPKILAITGINLIKGDKNSALIRVMWLELTKIE